MTVMFKKPVVKKTRQAELDDHFKTLANFIGDNCQKIEINRKALKMIKKAHGMLVVK